METKKELKNLRKKQPRIFNLLKIIIDFLPIIFPTVFTFFETIFSNQCKNFYGIILNCFDLEIYSARWIGILYISSVALIAIFYLKKSKQTELPKGFYIFQIIIQSCIWFCINLVMIILATQNPKLGKFFNSTSTISTWIFVLVATFSILLVISKFKLNENFEISNKILRCLVLAPIILQFIIFAISIYTYGLPNPENISTYTVATVENEREESEKYVVVGNYNNDFVCMEVKKAFDEQENELYLSNSNSKDYNKNINFNYSTLHVNKSEYKLLRSEDVDNFRTYYHIELVVDTQY